MYKISFVTTCPSDKHLMEPVIKQLSNQNVEFLALLTTNLTEAYIETQEYLKIIKPDILVVLGDRKEQLGATLAAFHLGVPVAHMFAGDISPDTTFDARHRHSMSLHSNILLCATDESFHIMIEVYRALNLPINNIHIVGSTHFDGIDISTLKDNSPEQYILIAVNPNTTGNIIENNRAIIDAVIRILNPIKKEMPIKIVRGNADEGSIDLITELHAATVLECFSDVVVLDNMPHEDYLKYMSKCMLFISNSSSLPYEARVILPFERIYEVGDRNTHRAAPRPMHRVPSEHIASILLEYLNTK